MITRVLRELGRPCRLHRNCRLETRLTNSRLIRGPLHRPRKIHRASNDDARDALSSGATRLMLRPRY